MGSEYTIYTEAKIDNEWICLNSYVVDKKTKKYSLTPTYWNGSRTYFSDALNKIRDIGYVIPYHEISKEIQTEFGYDEEDIEYFHAYAFYAKDLIRLSDSSIHSCSGYVTEKDIFKFEKEHEDIYEYLSLSEYLELDEEAKKLFKSYNWDPYDSWIYQFKKIVESYNHTIFNYDFVNILQDNVEMRLICVIS